MSSSEFKVIDQKIGLVGATILLVGNVIAMTVFLLPAHLLADGAGPSVALAMLVAAFPVAFSILTLLQLGGAMPAAGGSYVYGSRLINPFFGFLLPWIVVPAIWLGQLYLAFGFAEFMRFFEVGTVGGVTLFSDVPLAVLMYAVLIPFIVVNVLGLRIVTGVQIILVAVIVSGMLLFILPGSVHVDAANYTPMFPEGFGPFIVAVVSLSIAMHGFGLATDLGEEMKDPVTNIPRALGLSAFISIGLMVGVVVVAIGVTPWQDWAGVEAGVAVIAGDFLPWWAASFVALAAVVGAFTSINTLYTAYSRQVMRAARDDAIPIWFAKIHDSYQTPYRAILLLSVPALFLVPFTPSPVLLAVALTVTSMIGSMIGAVALWNLPKRFPDRYTYSIYRLPMPLLRFVAIAGFAVSATFVFLVSLQDEPGIMFNPMEAVLGLAEALGVAGAVPRVGALDVEVHIVLVVVAWFVVAYPVYRYRVRKYERRGVDLRARMKQLHDYEEERAQEGSRQE